MVLNLHSSTLNVKTLYIHSNSLLHSAVYGPQSIHNTSQTLSQLRELHIVDNSKLATIDIRGWSVSNLSYYFCVFCLLLVLQSVQWLVCNGETGCRGVLVDYLTTAKLD